MHNNRKFRQMFFTVPVFGYIVRALNFVLRSPHYYDKLDARISWIEKRNGLFADNHSLDKFYTEFEDKFRGKEQDIKKRLEVYIPNFTKNTTIDFSKYPVLDIGSGRGEFLQVLASNNIRAKGLDINTDMVNRSRSKGLNVVHADALDYLKTVEPQSIGAITGFHIVEHIPFENLILLFAACLEALRPDGFIIFETPNPENIVVGSYTFYMDPSHLHPLPPQLLKYTCESVGFSKVDIQRLHPAREKNDMKLPVELFNHFYGPRDYAIIAYK